MCAGLGYEGKAVAVAKGESIGFELPKMAADSIEVEVRLLPNHPIEGGQLRFSLAVNGHETAPIAYETYGRSEEWKQNVLRNQAIRRVVVPIAPDKAQQLTFTALDEGVVLDQIYLFTHQ